MTSPEIRQRFIGFFKRHGHTPMPPSSLIPPGDASVLFTTAGMQQFKEYYRQPELAGSPRMCSIQPSLRTSDIEEVGDNRHLTLFEMLGNFSFGYRQGEPEDRQSPTPYFKETAIRLAHQFITEELKIDLSRVYVTVYEGDTTKCIPRDEESAQIWQSLNVRDIRFEGADNFWGPTGSEGPCGPTSEIYVDDIEVWNLVFNQYYANANGQLEPLEFAGVDTGSGLERLAVVLQDKREVFETDLFADIIAAISHAADQERYQERAAKIIADHLKAAIFLIADGVRPSNKAQGYILRRLIRRLAVNAQAIGLSNADLEPIIETIYKLYSTDYDRLAAEYGLIVIVLRDELAKFEATLKIGLKEFARAKELAKDKGRLADDVVFRLFDTYGFPVELTEELAGKDGLSIDREAFNAKYKAHQEQSRAGLERVFTGGLADTEPATIRHHTAHHLLLAALREVLGHHVYQRGSNVTAERLRLDFSHPEKLTDEQLSAVSARVNQAIKEDLPVIKVEMDRDEAEKLGAMAEFGAKYGQRVTVYTIKNKDGSPFSIEYCGGPHVSRTGELGRFMIIKEEASSAGVRRIKARVEPLSSIADR